MIHPYRFPTIVLMLLAALFSSCPGRNLQSRDEGVSVTALLTADTSTLEQAVALASAAFVERFEPLTENYVMTAAEQMAIDGRWIWRLTFKPSRLLPDDPSTEMIGTGGEIFVNVDLDARTTEFRFGE